jgi:hypothetical protein
MSTFGMPDDVLQVLHMSAGFSLVLGSTDDVSEYLDSPILNQVIPGIYNPVPYLDSIADQLALRGHLSPLSVYWRFGGVVFTET